MKLTFLPKSTAGKKSAWFFAAFIALAVIGGTLSAALGNTIEYPSPISSPVLGSTIFLMFAAAVVAAIFGIVAIKRHEEHSLLIYVIVSLGVFYVFGIAVLLIGVLIGPPRPIKTCPKTPE